MSTSTPAPPSTEDRLTALETKIQKLDKRPAELRVNVKVAAALAAFGTLLGLLTALSTQVGATATLFAFLTAFVGGSLLAWFQPQQLSADRLPTMASGILGLSLGAISGLLIAFYFRAHDPFVDHEVAKQAATARNRQEEAASQAQIARSNLKSRLYAQAASFDVNSTATDAQQTKVAELLKLAASLETATPVPTGAPTQSRGLFVLQSEYRSKLSAAVQDLEETTMMIKDATGESVKKNDLKKLDQILTSLKLVDNKLSQSD